MEQARIDGYKWDAIEVAQGRKSGRNEDMYLYFNGITANTYLKAKFLESAGISDKANLQLYSQGTEIFMIKEDEWGTIRIAEQKVGRYVHLGGKDLARKLKQKCDTEKFEVIEAVDGHILFRPIH